MAASTMTDVSLPNEAKAVIWRLFGAGESPLTGRSTFDLIERVICKHVSSSTQRGAVIAAIRGWFEIIGERRWLKQDMREPVAVFSRGRDRHRSVGDRNLGHWLDRWRLGSEHHSFSLESREDRLLCRRRSYYAWEDL